MTMLHDAYPAADHDQDDRSLARMRARVARLERLLADQVAFGYPIADLIPIIDESKRALQLMLERQERITRLQRYEQTAGGLAHQ